MIKVGTVEQWRKTVNSRCQYGKNNEIVPLTHTQKWVWIIDLNVKGETKMF